MSEHGVLVSRKVRCGIVFGAFLGVASLTSCDEWQDAPTTPAQPPLEQQASQPLAEMPVELFEDADGQVAATFPQPVSLNGDIYLMTDRRISLPLTRESRNAARGSGGVEHLVWDRRVIEGPFAVTGWERGAVEVVLVSKDGRATTADFAPVSIGALVQPVGQPKPSVSPTSEEVERLLVDRLNLWRMQAGVPALTQGGKSIATRHARLSLENCTSSHWDVYGLKPHHRYAISGGIQYVEENWGGTTSFCVTEKELPEATYVTGDDMSQAIDELLVAFKSSDRHAASLLDPHARYVHVGVAWDPRNLKVALLLERHLVNDDPTGMFRLSPKGELVVWGSFRESARLSDKARLRVYYEDIPARLSRGQLARTSCYTVGSVLVAVVVRPEGQRQWVGLSQPRCPDPAEASVGEPRSEEEGLELHRAAMQVGEEREDTWMVPAVVWEEQGRGFRIEADLAAAMLRTGRFCPQRVCPGIYTVQLEVVTTEGSVIAAQQVRWLGGAPDAEAVRFYSPSP